MKTRTKVIILLVIVLLIALIPLFALKGAEFGGSDDAGSQVVNEITGGDYQPWFTPVMESWIGGELPGEIESLLFCVQTGIGVGIIAFVMGRLVERNKKEKTKSGKSGDSGDSNIAIG
ncbi:cobalt/nickel transport protein [Sporobacter termitidis DSM 10068]|uniref:Cobalt transport protein CbiN n=1 Tax=Sporobacter termitidis DSM 10068 TaxID=1123282 RepID=A0A1M5XI56_9FIRM|nr:energy-coupling factor ABC transporter substrate-binding protein [Sporobacter termitidis]SHH98943.1 cobalt/nickel transport protein [Sporobacter termitidis DSM 10068]